MQAARAPIHRLQKVTWLHIGYNQRESACWPHTHPSMYMRLCTRTHKRPYTQTKQKHVYTHATWCLYAYLRRCLCTCLHMSMRMHIHMFIHNAWTCLHACLFACLFARLLRYPCTCLHTYLHTCMHTCLHKVLAHIQAVTMQPIIVGHNYIAHSFWFAGPGNAADLRQPSAITI